MNRQPLPLLAILPLWVLSFVVVPCAACRKQGDSRDGEKPAAAPGPGDKGKLLFYRAPMSPGQTSPVPRQDEMGMDYVPVYESDVAAPSGLEGLATVTIDSQRQQLIGVKLVAVRRGPFAATIRTVGRVAYDETHIHHVHTKYEAYVERLYADFTGKYVRRGEPLVSLYSPDVLSAEQEYLLALRNRRAGGTGGEDLARSARQRLLLWDIRSADIDALEKSGVPSQTLNLYAPISGYVVGKTAVHGMRMRPEDSLFDIADLSHVWVLADIYEYELPRVRIGQTAIMTLSYWPDRSWKGRVSYIFPNVDPRTRTVRARLEFDNPHDDLKVDMYADVTIAVAQRIALVVPQDAVLQSGTRSIVFVSLGEGRLQPREIVTGDEAGRLYEVKSGLSEGELVATGANFLVDSESRLQAAISSLTPPPPAQAAPPDGGPAKEAPAGQPR